MKLRERVLAWWNCDEVRELRDLIFVTRARAIEMGFTHTAQFCGCFHYVVPATPRTTLDAMPRWGLLEIWCVQCIRWHQFKNDWDDTDHEFVFTQVRRLADASLASPSTIRASDEWTP